VHQTEVKLASGGGEAIYGAISRQLTFFAPVQGLADRSSPHIFFCRHRFLFVTPRWQTISRSTLLRFGQQQEMVDLITLDDRAIFVEE
jgi:hypothetical protein